MVLQAVMNRFSDRLYEVILNLSLGNLSNGNESQVHQQEAQLHTSLYSTVNLKAPSSSCPPASPARPLAVVDVGDGLLWELTWEQVPCCF